MPFGTPWAGAGAGVWVAETGGAEAAASTGVKAEALTAEGAQEIGMLRAAASGKGNFGIGSASESTAIRLGKDWVGEGYTVASDGKTLLSADMLRQFRPPSFKPNLGLVQANFESRWVTSGQWQANGHLDIMR